MADSHSHGRTQRAVSTANTAGLTQRELEFLYWRAIGRSSKETGMILGIAAVTVRRGLSAAMEKLDSDCACQAVAKAVAWGLIQVPGAEVSHG